MSDKYKWLRRVFKAVNWFTGLVVAVVAIGFAVVAFHAVGWDVPYRWLCIALIASSIGAWLTRAPITTTEEK